MLPSFGDLRVIMAGFESMRLGFDPLVENPCDPWGRSMNYPRIWQKLEFLGLTQTHSNLVGVIFGLIYAAACFLVVRSCRRFSEMCLMMAGFMSPVSILCIERGNIDLLIFTLTTVLSLIVSGASTKKRFFGVALVFFSAFFLKLYPIFCSLVFLRYRLRIQLAILALSLIVVFVYVVFQADELRLIRSATPAATSMSYGLDVIWMQISKTHPAAGPWAKVLSIGVYIGCLMLIPVAAIQTGKKRGSLRPVTHLELASFRIAAGVYLGTFALGNNYDYRLIFVIPAIGLLMRCAQFSAGPDSSSMERTVASLVLMSLMLSVWHLVILQHLARYLGPLGFHIAFVIDGVANWLMVAGFCWYLGATWYCSELEIQSGNVSVSGP